MEPKVRESSAKGKKLSHKARHALIFKSLVKIYDNCDGRGSNLQSPALEADALSIGPPEPMASSAKSVIVHDTDSKENDETQTTKRKRDTAETRPRQGLHKVCTRSTLGLH